MSGTLSIRFSPDMPAALVEVLSPDLQTVDRVPLTGGKSRTVEVPSEASFLRVHLASGQVVTLKDPGNLNRVITPAMLGEQSVAAKPEKAKTFAGPAPEAEGFRWMWNDKVQPGGTQFRREVVPNPQSRPDVLACRTGAAVLATVVLPANLVFLSAEAALDPSGNNVELDVRLASESPQSDMILQFLQRGDLYSAEGMERWVEDAEDMLRAKMADPYQAAVAGYLLLRLRRYERLHDWARNLANWFEFLSDGAVIWAWQLILTEPKKAEEIETYLLEAARRDPPVYTEGARLLTEGLRLLGDKGREPLAGVHKRLGNIVWTAPVRTRLERARGYDQAIVNVAFQPA